MIKPTAFISEACFGSDYMIGMVSDHPNQREFKKTHQLSSEVVKIWNRPDIDGVVAFVETQNTMYTVTSWYEAPV